MASHGLYSVNDIKAENYLAPFVSLNNQTAVRYFSTAVMDKQHDFHIHSEDYSLWKIGTFDTETTIITQEPKELLCHALELKNQITATQ